MCGKPIVKYTYRLGSLKLRSSKLIPARFHPGPSLLNLKLLHDDAEAFVPDRIKRCEMLKRGNHRVLSKKTVDT